MLRADVDMAGLVGCEMRCLAGQTPSGFLRGEVSENCFPA